MKGFVPLDLTDYYNHILIGDRQKMDESSLEDAGIHGNLADPADFPKSHVCIDAIPFILPDKTVRLYDNITCEGQTILLPGQSFHKIHCLGNSESDNFTEELSVQFADGGSETVWVFFPFCYKKEWKWNFEKEIFHKVAFEFPVYNSESHKANMDVFYLFGEVRCDKLMSCLTLPYNPSVHLFAVTLEI